MSGLSEVNINRTHEPSYVTDLAELLDQPREILAEKLCVSQDAALRVILWAQSALDAARNESKAVSMAMVLSELVPAKPGNLEAIVAGLLFAAGAASVNGWKSEADAAKRLARKVRCPHCGRYALHTMTRALISHYTVRWADKLGCKNFRFRREEQARENSRKARNRVVGNE
jgi:hypothetical protein